MSRKQEVKLLHEAAQELAIREEGLRWLCTLGEVRGAYRSGRGDGWHIPAREVRRWQRRLGRRVLVKEETDVESAG